MTGSEVSSSYPDWRGGGPDRSQIHPRGFVSPVANAKRPGYRTGLRLAVLPVLLCVFAMAGCSEPPDSMTLLSREGSNPQIFRLLDEWNASHELQIRATLVPQRDFMTKFGVSLAGGVVPDLVAIDLIYVPRFTAIGQLTDISELLRSMPYYDSFIPSHVRLAIWEGRNYGLPFAVEGSFLLYNKALFRAAGLNPEKPPANWNELYRYAGQISAIGDDVFGFYFSGACGGCAIFTLAPLIWASGGDIANEDYTEATLDSPEVAAALKLYRRLWQAGYVPPGAIVDGGENFTAAFLTGKVGMVASGAFIFEQLENRYPNLEYGVALLPGQYGGSASFAGGDVLAIPKKARHVEEAREFIRWYTRRDVQERNYADYGVLPVRLDLADHPAYATPAMQTALKTLEIGLTPMTPKYNDLIGDLNGPWALLIQQAIFGDNVELAIAAANRRFQEIMDE